MDSILITIKKLLGLEPEYTDFDPDIIICINTTFSILTQLGVGPKEGFSIIDDSANWNDYIEDMARLEMVKSYIYMKVRLMFDPPQNGILTDSINNQIKELEWRLNVQVDPC